MAFEMKLLKKVITRLNITIALIAVQAAMMVFLFSMIVSNFQALAVISYTISSLIVLALVKKDEASAYKVIWIIVIMALPISGGILYLLFGNKRPTRRIAAHLDEHALIAKLLQSDDHPEDDHLIHCDRAAGCLQYIR
jgi:cardiolipin synthase